MSDDEPAMNWPLLVSAAAAILTTGAAMLWAVAAASGMEPDAGVRAGERRDIRTW